VNHGGAGDGNRTRMASLEDCVSTVARGIDLQSGPVTVTAPSCLIFVRFDGLGDQVDAPVDAVGEGAAGLLQVVPSGESERGHAAVSAVVFGVLGEPGRRARQPGCRGSEPLWRSIRPAARRGGGYWLSSAARSPLTAASRSWLPTTALDPPPPRGHTWCTSLRRAGRSRSACLARVIAWSHWRRRR
jgi:hypothetical protein